RDGFLETGRKTAARTRVRPRDASSGMRHRQKNLYFLKTRPFAKECKSTDQGSYTKENKAAAWYNSASFMESIMSMSDRDGFIWYDGKLVPWRDATTHVLTHSLHYGLAVFEGERAYNTELGTAVFRLREHTDRLFNSAHIYQMQVPFDRETIMQATLEVVRKNQLESCYIRPLLFYGSEKMGVSPKGSTVHVAIAAWPWGAYLGEEALAQGIRVKISSYARQHVNVTMPRAKVASTYANSILANTEAIEHGYDEAILLDTDGFVAEGSGENIFIVKNGVLYEPEI